MIGLKIHMYPVTQIYTSSHKQKTPRMWGFSIGHQIAYLIL